MSAPSIQDMDYFAWDYTAYLNMVILPLGAWLGWIGTRNGGDHGTAAGPTDHGGQEAYPSVP